MRLHVSRSQLFLLAVSSLCVGRADCRVAHAVVWLLEEMWTSRSSSCALVEATTVLFSILPQFNDQSQHDAQELLLFLLNELHDDLQKVREGKRIRSGLESENMDYFVKSRY